MYRNVYINVEVLDLSKAPSEGGLLLIFGRERGKW